MIGKATTFTMSSQPVSPLWYSRISRTSCARKGERRHCAVSRKHCPRKAWAICFVWRYSFNIQTCCFLARPSALCSV